MRNRNSNFNDRHSTTGTPPASMSTAAAQIARTDRQRRPPDRIAQLLRIAAKTAAAAR